MEIELKMCEEPLKWHEKDMSVLKRVAEEKPPIEHYFCDPDGKQCTDLRIERDNWTKREHYWLDRLQQKVPDSEYPVLFICGADHVDTFSKLLEENDFNVICICKDWNLNTTES